MRPIDFLFRTKMKTLKSIKWVIASFICSVAVFFLDKSDADDNFEIPLTYEKSLAVFSARDELNSGENVFSYLPRDFCEEGNEILYCSAIRLLDYNEYYPKQVPTGPLQRSLVLEEVRLWVHSDGRFVSVSFTTSGPYETINYNQYIAYRNEIEGILLETVGVILTEEEIENLPTADDFFSTLLFSSNFLAPSSLSRLLGSSISRSINGESYRIFGYPDNADDVISIATEYF